MALSIFIIAGMNASLSSVTATGNDFHVITDQEASVFKIGNENILRDIAENYIGKRPNRVYLRSDSSWNDIYETHGWQQVESTLKVKNANIKGITSKPIIIDTKTLSNKSSHRATFNAGISSEVANTVETNWSTTHSLSFSQAINYGIQFNGIGLGGESGFNYTGTWGKGGMQSQTITIGSTTGVTVELDPGETVTAELIANKGTMDILINYDAILEGNLALNYYFSYNGHRHWSIPIKDALLKSGMETNKQITEEIQIGYYSHSSVVIKDIQGKVKKLYYLNSLGEVLNMEGMTEK